MKQRKYVLLLLIMGLKKSYWIFFDNKLPFGQLQESLHWFHILFVVFGTGILAGLYRIIFILLRGIKRTLNNGVN